MFQWLKTKRIERIVKRSPITDSQWQEGFHRLSLLQRLSESEKSRLQQLAILFLYYKSLEGAGSLEVSTGMRVVIALQACLPVLNLGLDWYDGWRSVIIYPGAFSKQSIEVDDCGVVHQGRSNLSGESWQRGPVILSWDDSLPACQADGRNVVIHEFAHKLDMLNGRANGLPSLHKGMSVQQWSDVFNSAYEDFQLHLQQHQPRPIDSYAATSPAEFFAVFSEVFFEDPAIIKKYYPDVYTLLVQFYRQDPCKN